MERMERVNPEAIRRLLNDGNPISEDTQRLSPSYGARVAEELMKLFAGNPSRPSESEFKLMVGAWTETLQDAVPEYRLGDAFVHARRTRNSNFQLDVSEVCNAWKTIREAERSIPATGSYEWSRAREVCADCNNTGSKLMVKRHPVLGRDYTYSVPCAVI